MEKTLKILSIDPGINNTGYSFGLFNVQNDTLTIKDYGMIFATIMAKKERKDDYKIYGSIIPHEIYNREIANLFEAYRPDYVVCESAFYNPHMPQAFLSLSLCIHIIKTVLYTKHMLLHTIAPKEAKKIVHSATADKKAIQESIHHIKDLVVKHTKLKPYEKMTEHEADSIAISYAFCKTQLRNLLLSSAC